MVLERELMPDPARSIWLETCEDNGFVSHSNIAGPGTQNPQARRITSLTTITANANSKALQN